MEMKIFHAAYNQSVLLEYFVQSEYVLINDMFLTTREYSILCVVSSHHISLIARVLPARASE